MTILSIAVFIPILLATASERCLATEIDGDAEVVDGDTIRIGNVRIRLFGIDAAESRQRCVTDQHRIARPGEEATEALSTLVANGLNCIGSQYDDYGRLLAICRDSKGRDINQQMVLQGWAWAFVKYARDYIGDEQEAKRQRRGVWAMACETPWDFRSHRWQDALQRAPEGCPIKGNISKAGKIYHVPWDRDYPKTRVDTSKGERWFCSEKQAIDAGWRAPRG